MAKILLVEDNENNRDMLQRRLARRGFEVVTAVDGPQAVALAGSERPALILMDIEMHDSAFDGLEATRRIKADDATRAIPVIALTGHAMSEHRDGALRAGCDDYDTKPVDFPRLLDKIQALLDRQANA